MEMLYLLECIVIYMIITARQSTVVASNAGFTGPYGGFFVKFPFNSLAVGGIATKRVSNEMHCSMNCQRNGNCFSFNFGATNDSVGNFLCELLATKHSYKHKNFKTNDSFHHFSWKIPEDFCSPNAKNFPSRNSDDTYDCPCKDGYIGPRCKIDIDECASSPCVNGKCKDMVNAYKCNCNPGYTGVNCETDIDECASNPCGNGSTCLDKINAYKCTCEVGFTGTNCETEFGACNSNPCKNNATCINLPLLKYKCECLQGYYGGKCFYRIYASNVTKSYENAEASCEKQGMPLARINNKGVNEVLRKVFQSNFWFGLRKYGSKWKWPGGDELNDEDDYRNWAQGLPGSGGLGQCVFMDWNDGKWKRDDCFSEYHFACLKYQT